MIQTRIAELSNLRHTAFDLLVIGGGITGAGIALDAAARGLRVALVEKGDFASGTSSKSTKLIHGGLRYLKQLEIKLVRETGRERTILHRLAPHLVKSEKMLLPIVRGGSFGKGAASLGLWLYDLLAGVEKNDRRRMLTAPQTIAAEPLLRHADLLGGGFYAEYRTDDARLTVEIIKTAVRHGATCLNYVEVENIILKNGKISGADCFDWVGNQRFSVTAQCVVNAAGPWVDHLRKKDNSLTGKRLFLSKGVHIVVAREKLPLRQAVYFDGPDGRMLFAIPRQRATYIGTTDTPFQGHPDEVFADKADIIYLLSGANYMFPDAKLVQQDVESTWAGLRPLIFEEHKSAGEMSRKDEIFESESGLISIAGGKLTGYRRMAGRVTDLVVKKVGAASDRRFEKCATQHIFLLEKPLRNAVEVRDFQHFIEEKIKLLHLPLHTANYLTETYGTAADGIVTRALQSHHPGGQALLESELTYCLTHEMVVHPEDFLVRRTGRLYFDIASVERHLDFVLHLFQEHFQWDDAWLAQVKHEMHTLLEKSR